MELDAGMPRSELKKRFRIETFGMSPIRNCPPSASRLSERSKKRYRLPSTNTICATL
jgi:hypothetical protein